MSLLLSLQAELAEEDNKAQEKDKMVAEGKANSVTHHNEWAAFSRMLTSRKSGLTPELISRK